MCENLIEIDIHNDTKYIFTKIYSCVQVTTYCNTCATCMFFQLVKPWNLKLKKELKKGPGNSLDSQCIWANSWIKSLDVSASRASSAKCSAYCVSVVVTLIVSWGCPALLKMYNWAECYRTCRQHALHIMMVNKWQMEKCKLKIL